jgi:hypothetical protein
VRRNRQLACFRSALASSRRCCSSSRKVSQLLVLRTGVLRRAVSVLLGGRASATVLGLRIFILGVSSVIISSPIGCIRALLVRSLGPGITRSLTLRSSGLACGKPLTSNVRH